MNTPNYKVFAHITGLAVFEVLFWILLGAVAVLLKRAAPQLDLHFPHMWPALLIAPVGLLLFAGHYRWKQKKMAQAVDVHLSRALWPDARPRRSVWKFLIWRTALAVLALGMLDPKWGTKMEEVQTDGVDIMVALDVSKSMLTEDLGMSRLDLAKRTIERLVQRLDGDRIGLVVFAGDAYVQAPLTMDFAAVKLFLDATTPDAIPLQGTAVGRAITLCKTSFDAESKASRVVLILTDGENHEDDALARAKEASQEGIAVHALGMASEGGGPIPNLDRFGRQQGYKSDETGQPIVSTLDERMLVSLAEAGQGTYVRASKGYVDLSPFLTSLMGLDGGEGQSVAYTDYQHQFHWFFGIGLLLLLIEGAWPLGHRTLPRFWVLGLLAFLPFEGMAQSPLGKTMAVQGSEAMAKRDFVAADSLFDQARSWEGAEPGQLAMNRGFALASQGQTEAALQSFQEAASQSPDARLQSDAWNNVGNVLLGNQDVEGAIEAYRQSLRLDPQDAETRYNLSLAYAMRQQQEQQEQQDQDQQDQDQQDQDQQNQDQQDQDQQDQDQQDQDQQDQDQQDQGQQNGDQQDQDQQNGDQQNGDQQDKQDEDQQSGNRQDQEQQGQPKDGQIQPEDAERILDLLERNEAALRTKLQAQENAERRKANRKKIEKDW